MAVFHDEIEIEDFEYDEETETFTYPCPCGDEFEITKVCSFIRDSNLIFAAKLSIWLFRFSYCNSAPFAALACLMKIYPTEFSEQKFIQFGCGSSLKLIRITFDSQGEMFGKWIYLVTWLAGLINRPKIVNYLTNFYNSRNNLRMVRMLLFVPAAL